MPQTGAIPDRWLPLRMRHPLLTILLCIFFSCNSDNRIAIKFPTGGYSYPTIVDNNNEHFLFYALKDSLAKDDSFNIAYYSSYLLKAFNEPNLSLKSQGKIIFRFIYEGPMEQPLLINFTQNEIVIKEGVKGVIYPERDETRLSEIERQHFNLLKWRYPLTDSIKNKGDKQYIDSLLNIYPNLTDQLYYVSLLKKIELPIIDTFHYTLKRIKISNKEFIELIETINRSGYWNFPFEIECHNMPTDVGGYSLEANTPDRYNVVTELDCDVTNFKTLCRELLKVAKIKKRL